MVKEQNVRPDPPGWVSLRRVMEVVALVAVLAIAFGVWLETDTGWALITGGVLTTAWSLLIVDVPPRPVHTGPRAPRSERG